MLVEDGAIVSVGIGVSVEGTGVDVTGIGEDVAVGCLVLVEVIVGVSVGVSVGVVVQNQDEGGAQ